MTTFPFLSFPQAHFYDLVRVFDLKLKFGLFRRVPAAVTQLHSRSHSELCFCPRAHIPEHGASKTGYPWWEEQGLACSWERQGRRWEEEGSSEAGMFWKLV